MPDRSRLTKILVFAVFTLVLLIGLSANVLAGTGNGAVEFYVFSSSDCPDCIFLQNQMLPELQKKYGDKIDFKYYDLAGQDIKTYKYMVELEDSYGRSELTFPQVYIGTHALIGPEEVKSLPTYIEQYAEQGGVDLPVVKIGAEVVQPPTPGSPNATTPTTPSPSPSGIANQAYIAYFYRSDCRKCDAVSTELAFLKSFDPNIHVREYDLMTKQGIEMNEAMSIAYSVPPNKRGIAPAVFVGREYLYGKDLNRKELSKAITTAKSSFPAQIPWEVAKASLGQVKKEIDSRISTLSVFTVMGAGLVDGLNPCALTVIVFLVAYLAFIGRKGREILSVGAAVSIMAFLTYLLVGLGLLSFIRAISRTGTVGTWITAVVASATAIFGLLSIYDYIRSRRTGELSSTIGLSQGVTRRIHGLIREHTKTKYLVIGAAVLGILITLFELGCTGQVYLPVITFVARAGGARGKAILYLVLFSVMSTLPLVVVFVLAYFGTSNEKMAEFGRKHTPALTLLGGVAMVALAVILFVSL